MSLINNKIENGQVRTKEEINQLHFGITSTKNNLESKSLKKEIKNTLEKVFEIPKDELKLPIKGYSQK